MATRDRNIVLTGFMGTGKSTVGALVAQRLKRRFVDMDAAIETEQGRSIPQIFAEDGEAAFRKMERELIAQLAELPELVIATGGGALIDPANRERMSASGLVICLDATPDAIAARLDNAATAGRPLASQWRDLYEQRRAIYALLPHRIDTDNKTPEQIASEVIALWES